MCGMHATNCRCVRRPANRKRRNRRGWQLPGKWVTRPRTTGGWSAHWAVQPCHFIYLHPRWRGNHYFYLSAGAPPRSKAQHCLNVVQENPDSEKHCRYLQSTISPIIILPTSESREALPHGRNSVLTAGILTTAHSLSTHSCFNPLWKQENHHSKTSPRPTTSGCDRAFLDQDKRRAPSPLTSHSTKPNRQPTQRDGGPFLKDSPPAGSDALEQNG